MNAPRRDPARNSSVFAFHSLGAPRALMVSWLAVILMNGCGINANTDPSPLYQPSWQEASQALETVLTAWRQAPNPMPPSFDTPAVCLVDKTRRPGQRLEKFEILNRTDVESARQFTVRLYLEGEEAPLLVRYNALGRQPVWVFRLDDYEMFSHWEHDMSEPAAPKGAKLAPRENQPAAALAK